MPPSISTQNTPRDAYPFRNNVNTSFNMSTTAESLSKVHHHLPQAQTASALSGLSSKGTNSPTTVTSSAFPFRDSAFRDSPFRDSSIRDLPLSPGPRGSVGSSSTVVGSRGSLSSLASVGTLSTRASMGSAGSLSSADSNNNTLSADSAPISSNMWHNTPSVAGEDVTMTSNITTGGIPTAPPSASSITAPKLSLASSSAINATLLISTVPRDITVRESHYLFALATDFVSVEMSRNAVSGDVSLVAKFSSLHGAQAAAFALERRSDLFGYELKTSVQSFASAPFGVGSVAQQNQGVAQPRNLYNSRSYFADSYWTQSPGTPLSPSGASDIFSNSRRASLISPTEHSHIGLSSLVPGSPSHNSQMYESTSSLINGADLPAPSVLASNGSSPSSNGSINMLNRTGSPISANGFGGANIFAHQHGTHSSTSLGSVSPSSKSVPPSNAGSVPFAGSVTSASSASNTSIPVGSSIGQPSHQSYYHSSQNESPTPQHINNSSHSIRQQHSAAHQSAGGHGPSATHVDVSKIPPPNPADQNPPCNTLYVGNLPPDTSENELKNLFSQQPGYRRLCFRTKQNGPMCFVEFEDEKLAGKALTDLYGAALSNSIKGGIRLSYSKNPLGVRSRPVRSK